MGNQAGRIGIAHAKAKQVPDAIKKATEVAKRNLIKIPLKDGRTLHHDVKGKNGSGKVFLRSAPAGSLQLGSHWYRPGLLGEWSALAGNRHQESH